MAYMEDARAFTHTLSDGEADALPPDELRGVLLGAVGRIEETLSSSLEPATAKHASVYVGRAGVALCFLRLARFRADAGDTAGAAATLARADAQLDAAELAHRGPHGPSFLEGAPGLAAVRAAVAAAAGRHGDAAAAAARVAALEADVARMPRGDCELLYGRAGYLHACLVARAAGGSAAVPDAVLVRTAEAVLSAGADAADAAGASFSRRWGLYFEWHGAAYLGGAHGLAGIVLTLLQTEAALAPAWRMSDTQASRVHAATLALADSLTRGGNLPTRVGQAREDRLVQWCHGAPAFLLLAAASARHAGAAGVPAARLAAPAAAAAECVWRRGLLRKGLGLCHGVAGNGYALLAHARAFGDARSLRCAAAFAAWGAAHLQELAPVPDRPHSLYEGIAGFAAFCLDVLRPELARMPGAEL